MGIEWNPSPGYCAPSAAPCWCTLEVLGPLDPQGRTRRSSGLCLWSGQDLPFGATWGMNQWVSERFPYLSFSLTLPFKQVNTSLKKQGRSFYSWFRRFCLKGFVLEIPSSDSGRNTWMIVNGTSKAQQSSAPSAGRDYGRLLGLLSRECACWLWDFPASLDNSLSGFGAWWHNLCLILILNKPVGPYWGDDCKECIFLSLGITLLRSILNF